MTNARFLQIHSLHSYSAALLNRDDTGLAKRLRYGGFMRTRISSQCLKRHWRANDSVFNLHNVQGAEQAYRSRSHLERVIFDNLPNDVSNEVKEVLGYWFEWALYSGNSKKVPKISASNDVKAGDIERQPLLFGEPEMRWLSSQFSGLVQEAQGDKKSAFELGENWAKAYKANIDVIRKEQQLPGGLTSALFGRMVTSDPEANIEAPVHVAHAFTVHEQEDESDYFSVVDDLKRDDEDAGAAHIGETELTSGLFYGYVVVDVPGLVKNLGGNRDMAGQVVQHLVHLIAEVSPGAKLGSTAPYGYAEFMMVEAGNRQPRSLSGAFRTPVAANLEAATKKLADHLAGVDAAYATGEIRAVMQIGGTQPPATQKTSLPNLVDWAGKVVKAEQAA